MIFLSSVYGLVSGARNPDVTNTRKLSKVLNISREPDALRFPIAIKSIIWYKHIPQGAECDGKVLKLYELCNPELPKEAQEILTEEILAKTPEWLRYAKPSQMRYDLNCLVKFLRNEAIA